MNRAETVKNRASTFSGGGTPAGARLIERHGNLLEDDAEALVNTVNCAGVMGKGIALQFRQAFPENLRRYEHAFRAGELRLGKMMVVETNRLTGPRFIINFPTKNHWRGPSRLEDIRSGLSDFVRVIKEKNIRSVALPPLGCGNGGLKWSEVRPLIAEAASHLPGVSVFVYTPQGAPAAAEMPIGSRKPALNVARASFLRLFEIYRVPDYALTKLEAQKLAYFLQEAGQSLRLKFEAQQFGPYAEALNHVLQNLEGHYIRGYGDRTARTELRLLPGAVEAARVELAKTPDAQARLDRVAELIAGFESPYGMELLATVHWVAKDKAVGSNPSSVVEAVHAWSERKRLHFRPEHIRAALNRLTTAGWLPPSGTAGHPEASQ